MQSPWAIPNDPRILYREDPPVREDGTCAVCGKPRRERGASRYATYEDFARDPFCSSTCARYYHGLGAQSEPSA